MLRLWKDSFKLQQFCPVCAQAKTACPFDLLQDDLSQASQALDKRECPGNGGQIRMDSMRPLVLDLTAPPRLHMPLWPDLISTSGGNIQIRGKSFGAKKDFRTSHQERGNSSGSSTMADGNVIAYSVAVFITALFILDFGADTFVDHTATSARLTGIPDPTIALLTVGVEQKEVGFECFGLGSVVPLTRIRFGSLWLSPRLSKDGRHWRWATLNIVGIVIWNILGAFSLGLLFRSNERPAHFDRSSRIQSVLMLIITAIVIPVTYVSRGTIWNACGAILIVKFVVYLVSIGWAISKWSFTAPVDLFTSQSVLEKWTLFTHLIELLVGTSAVSHPRLIRISFG